MDAWVWWLVLAAVMGIAETQTATLVFAMVAGGAVAGAGAAAAGLDPAWQVLAFALVTAGLLLFVRPVARRHLRQAPAARTGIDRLRGADAVVLERVDGRGGRVKLDGEIWSARAYDGGSVHEPGETVQVISIEGATALVA